MLFMGLSEPFKMPKDLRNFKTASGSLAVNKILIVSLRLGCNLKMKMTWSLTS